MPTKLLVLGAAGYLGSTVIREARAAGLDVIGLVRKEEDAKRLESAGAEAVRGDAKDPTTFQAALDRVGIVVDLVQPPLEKRISRAAIERIAVERTAMTVALCRALAAMGDRAPLYLSVGGCDELEPKNGVMDDASPLRVPPRGGGRIGVPVHAAIHDSGVRFTSLYFGVVYGPGKAFASTIVPKLRKNALPIIGSGKYRLPVIHVDDAARAIVHLTKLGPDVIAGRSFVAADPNGRTADDFFGAIARRVGAKPPRHAPTWLVSLIAGAGAVELMTTDATVKPDGLLSSGFSFRYPSIEEGIDAMIRALDAKSTT